MKYLIGNRVINADHIVMVDYDPAHSGIDNESGEAYTRKSNCVITLTSVHVEIHTVYDGSADGCASESDTILLRDTAADRFWEAYMRDAYAVVNP